MHSNAILRRNLLDIIFENRNKDYGAYLLRKNYNRRLLISLAIMLLLVMIFSLWQIVSRKGPIQAVIPVTFIPDRPLSPPPHFQEIKPKINSQTPAKASASLNNKGVDNKALIVKDFIDKVPLINLLSPTPDVINGNEAPFFETQGTGETGGQGHEGKAVTKALIPAVDKTIPDMSPEVLPQYPGGMSELVKFLQRHLHTPQDMQGEVSVKVRFVVNFNGNLVGFDVIETGGAIYDNEVIRVLKKMPKWIPGKTHGENVSTYFIIPVKFTVSD